MNWVDEYLSNGTVQAISAIAAAIGALGACWAAHATYRSVKEPANERRLESRAIAIAALDGFVATLATMRRLFGVRRLVISQASRYYDEGRKDEVEQGIRSISQIDQMDDIPILPAGYHNLDLVLALNRLRASCAQWKVMTQDFTFDIHSFFDDKEELERMAIEGVEELHARVVGDMRVLGKLLGDLFPNRRNELEIVVDPSDGFTLSRLKE